MQHLKTCEVLNSGIDLVLTKTASGGSIIEWRVTNDDLPKSEAKRHCERHVVLSCFELGSCGLGRGRWPDRRGIED